MISSFASERLTAIQDEKTRAQLLDIPPESDERLGKMLYRFGPTACEYVRKPENLLCNIAKENSERPIETIVRLFCETGGRQLFAFATNNHNLAHVEEVVRYRDTLLGLGYEGIHIMAKQTQIPESDDPKSEQFRDYIRHRQLEMLSEDLWDEYLWGELGAAVRDFENEPWGKPSEEDNPESS